MPILWLETILVATSGNCKSVDEVIKFMSLLVAGLSFGWVCILSHTIILLKLRDSPSFVGLLVVQCPFRWPHCKLPEYFSRLSARVGSDSAMFF